MLGNLEAARIHLREPLEAALCDARPGACRAGMGTDAFHAEYGAVGPWALAKPWLRPYTDAA
jgi:hypothetical protein